MRNWLNGLYSMLSLPQYSQNINQEDFDICFLLCYDFFPIIDVHINSIFVVNKKVYLYLVSVSLENIRFNATRVKILSGRPTMFHTARTIKHLPKHYSSSSRARAQNISPHHNTLRVFLTLPMQYSKGNPVFWYSCLCRRIGSMLFHLFVRWERSCS